MNTPNNRPIHSVFLHGTLCCPEERMKLLSIVVANKLTGEGQFNMIQKFFEENILSRGDLIPGCFDESHPLVMIATNKMAQALINAGWPEPADDDYAKTGNAADAIEARLAEATRKLLPEHWDNLSEDQHYHMMKVAYGLNAITPDCTCLMVLDINLLENAHMQRMYELSRLMAKRMGIPYLTLTAPYTQRDIDNMTAEVRKILDPIPVAKPITADSNFVEA